MTRRTTWIGLLSAALIFGCSGKKDAADKQPAPDKKPPDSTNKPDPDKKPPTPDGKPTPDKKPVTKYPDLVADPGGHQGKALWSHRLGGPGKDAVRSVAIDAAGNVAVTGYFSSGADFGDQETVEAKKVDAFVSKYNPDGTRAWTATFGGTGEDVGNGVVFDASGNLFVVGLFTDAMDIGEHKLKGQGSDDVFFAKFSPDGKPLWAHMFGGPDSDAANDLAIRPDGRIVVTGSFKRTVNTPSGAMKSKGNEDIFVLELDPDGGLVWVKQFGEGFRDFGQRIVLDSTGHAIILGQFNGDVSFGGKPLTSIGNQDLVLFKLDEKGGHVWSKRFGSNFNELGLGLATDPAGNIAITGSFDNEITFGGDKLASQGESDVFVAKFDAAGEHQWSTAFGAAREDIGYGMGMDKYGNIALGGWFWQSVDFGGGPLEANGQNKDAFLVKLSAKGEFRWAKRFGDRDHDQLRGVAVNADGKVAAAGIFRFTVDVGTGPLKSAMNAGDKAPPADVFVAVFEP